jgi:hypothetical protein
MADIVKELEQLAAFKAQQPEDNITMDSNMSPSGYPSAYTSDAPERNDKLMEKISIAARHSFLPAGAEFLKVKNYLTSSIGVKHPVSMYDHLTAVIMSSMESKNANIVGETHIDLDNFEKLSLAVKFSQIAANTGSATNAKVSLKLSQGITR